LAFALVAFAGLAAFAVVADAVAFAAVPFAAFDLAAGAFAPADAVVFAAAFPAVALAADFAGGPALVAAFDLGPVAVARVVVFSAAAVVFFTAPLPPARLPPAASAAPAVAPLPCAAPVVTRTPAFSPVVTLCAGMALFGAFRTEPARSAMAIPHIQNGTRRGAAHSEGGKNTEPTVPRQTRHTLTYQSDQLVATIYLIS
jgi:hypothetical protein